MADSYRFGSLGGHQVAFLLFAAFSILCGFAVARIGRTLTRSNWREPRGRAVPVYGAIGGVLLGSVILTAVWYWLWSGFHTLGITEGRVILQYEMPRRERVLRASDITGIRWRPAPRSTKRFVITMEDGSEYFSMQTSVERSRDAALLESIRHAMRRDH